MAPRVQPLMPQRQTHPGASGAFDLQKHPSKSSLPLRLSLQEEGLFSLSRARANGDVSWGGMFTLRKNLTTGAASWGWLSYKGVRFLFPKVF